MDDDYYSIDSILAENQKIQCTFKVDIPEMGHLDGGDERDIKALSKIQLPIWMAYILIYSNYAGFTVPPPFSNRVKNALKAEPRSVRLSALVGHGASWYAFGRIYMRLLSEEGAAEMSENLAKTFRDRLAEVIDQAQHFAALGPVGGAGQSNDVAAAFREGLDATERDMFTLAQDSARSTKHWYESTDRGRK
ncbi:GINS complex Psf3 component [Peniophora sp. CONT]|nr:GINS complex Psf3 component [Peniophora sp. CONT]